MCKRDSPFCTFLGATTRERQRQGACPEQGGERKAADRKRGEIPGLGGGRSLGRRGFRRRGIRHPHLDRGLHQRRGHAARRRPVRFGRKQLALFQQYLQGRLLRGWLLKPRPRAKQKLTHRYRRPRSRGPRDRRTQPLRSRAPPWNSGQTRQGPCR